MQHVGQWTVARRLLGGDLLHACICRARVLSRLVGHECSVFAANIADAIVPFANGACINQFETTVLLLKITFNRSFVDACFVTSSDACIAPGSGCDIAYRAVLASLATRASVSCHLLTFIFIVTGRPHFAPPRLFAGSESRPGHGTSTL